MALTLLAARLNKFFIFYFISSNSNVFMVLVWVNAIITQVGVYLVFFSTMQNNFSSLLFLRKSCFNGLFQLLNTIHVSWTNLFLQNVLTQPLFWLHFYDFWAKPEKTILFLKKVKLFCLMHLLFSLFSKEDLWKQSSLNAGWATGRINIILLHWFFRNSLKELLERTWGDSTTKTQMNVLCILY